MSRQGRFLSCRRYNKEAYYKLSYEIAGQDCRKCTAPGPEAALAKSEEAPGSVERLRSEVLHQAGLEQHRGGLQRSLQARLQRQDLRPHLLDRRALDVLEQAEDQAPGLNVAFVRCPNGHLGAGEVARDVTDLLPPRS